MNGDREKALEYWQQAENYPRSLLKKVVKNVVKGIELIEKEDCTKEILCRMMKRVCFICLVLC